MRYLIATNAVDDSQTLCDSIRTQVGDGDTVYALNSLHGGDDTSSEDVEAGRDAIEQVTTELGDIASVETHQLIRGNDPATDILDFAQEHDVDRIVIGIRKRSPTGKAVFGSTAQDVLLSADRPVLAIPRSE